MAAPPSQERSRLAGLDGIRGLAALFVVLHHCWLMSFPGFPADNGPFWAGWLLYGHFAVVVFIVLSGFSLAVGPARRDWRLGGLARFAHRRAWRILPPYWAALLYSLIVAWTVVPQTDGGPPTAKSVLVYGLLVQDVFGAPSPNGAFWSIAIEAQLYVVFPLLLLVIRRFGAAVMAVAVTAVVAAVGALSPAVPAVAFLDRFTPQFAALFALGAVAAGVVGGHWRAPAPWLPVVAVAPVLALIAVRGSVWTVGHYFWVDLALGPAVGLFLASLAAGRPAPLVAFLGTRPLRTLGSFSYSLYLTHAPLVVALYELVVAPHVAKGVPAFLTTVALAVPACVALAWGFAVVFELPFQRHRSRGALLAAIAGRLRPPRRTTVAAPPCEPEKSPAP
ncbi:acyltransferase [Microbispora hainanensis]|uniref:acyltransferase family protein n=1 Tax=Microbispora hainanensis TaxID=568844 RepID=UPI0034097BD2